MCHFETCAIFCKTIYLMMNTDQVTWYHDGLLLDTVATVARNSSHQTLILEPVTHKDIGELEREVLE